MNTYYPFDENAANSITETLTVSGGQVRLRHIPQEGSVTIVGLVETNSLILDANKFRVDYYDANGNYRDASRRIFFHDSKNGTIITVKYTAVGTPVTAADMNEIKAHIENNSIHDSTIRFRGVMSDFPTDKQVGDVVFQGSGKSFIWSGSEWLPFKIGSGGSGAGGLSDDVIAQIAKAKKAWLPFSESMTADVYNNSIFYSAEYKWTLGYNPPSDTGIRDGKAYFDGKGWIDGRYSAKFDKKSFTVDFWAQMDSDAPAYAGLLDLVLHSIFIRRNGSNNQTIEMRAKPDTYAGGSPSFFYAFNTPAPLTERFHLALVYDQSATNTLRLFFNGSCLFSQTYNLNYGVLTAFGDIGKVNYGGNSFWKGYLENFRYIQGAALWTDDFTPPDSPEVYAAQMGTS